jgi:hypothetical protein
MHPSEHAQSVAAALTQLEWRRDRIVEAGVSSASAEAIAADPRFDLHAFLTLIDRGCPPELALRILAPLQEDLGQC